MAIARITKAYICHYSDNDQTTAYVEWVDGRGKPGRTEQTLICPCCGAEGLGVHMLALLARAPIVKASQRPPRLGNSA